MATVAWVAYAEDALRWHRQRTLTLEQLPTDLARVASWRETNKLDLARVIRQKRGSADS